MTSFKKNIQRYPLRKPYDHSSSGLGPLIGLIFGKDISKAQRLEGNNNNKGRFHGHAHNGLGEIVKQIAKVFEKRD